MCANSGHNDARKKTIDYYMKGHGLERSRIYLTRTREEAAKHGNNKAKIWLIKEDLRDALEMIRRWTE